MKLIKNQGASFILNVCLVVLTLVSIITYAVNKALPYFIEANVSAQIVPFLILALIFELVNVALGFTSFKSNKYVALVCDVLSIVTTFFLIGAAIYFINDRVDYYGYALFSDLESGNQVAKSGCIGAIVSTAFMFVAGFVSVATNFVKKVAE